MQLSLPPALREIILRYTVPRTHHTRQNHNLASEGLLSPSNDANNKYSKSKWTTPSTPKLSPRWLLGGTALVLFIFALLTTHRTPSRRALSPLEITGYDAQYLYVLLPALYPPVEMCKTALTANLLNYPTPTLLDLEIDDSGNGHERMPQEDRIPMVLEYLQHRGKRSEDALVVLVDSASGWFQLRPEVLLKRYYEINRRANEGLRTRFGEEFSQRVVFSAQRGCGTHRKDEAACLAVPEPEVVPGMSKASAPRHLSMGAVIGPLKDVRRIYELAAKKAGNKGRGANAHKVISELFARQEIRRETIRRQNLSWFKRAWYASSTQAFKMLQSVEHLDESELELGIGLDYAGELSALTNPSTDYTWTTHASLPADIAGSMPPFWSALNGVGGLPTEKTWSDVQLLTHKHTSIAPALIINDPTSATQVPDTNQPPHEAWWPHLWLHSHARALLSASTWLPSVGVASAQTETGVLRTFWNAKTTMDRAGAWSENGRFVGLEDMCAGGEQVGEIWRDGVGGWVRPVG